MYEDLVGKDVCGCTILEIHPPEGRRHTRALVDTHCPECGIHTVRLCYLLKKQKYACPHAAGRAGSEQMTGEIRDKIRDKVCRFYEEKMRAHAEEWLGRDDGTFHIHEIVTDVPFKPRQLRTYVRVKCLSCGREMIIDAQRIGKAKCLGCVHPQKHGGITKKYPRLYNSLKRHWQKCYDPFCDGYHRCGGKGWYFDERWIRYENGKQMLNTPVAIADCLEAGWDESNPRMILEKDKLAIELNERVIGKQTVRCVDRSENSMYRFDDRCVITTFR